MQATSVDEDWYRTPLYYDIIFDQDTAEEVDFVERIARRYLAGRKTKLTVLEPACGTGRLMTEMARRGHRVCGFDLEPAMVEFTAGRLREEGLRGRVEQGRMERFDFGEGGFDLAHCFVSTFKYLLSERAARSHLREVARHLRPGGLYLLGFHLTDYGNAEAATERWKGRRGGVAVDCVIDSDKPDPVSRLEGVRSSLRICEGRRQRTLDSEWEFRTYDAAQTRSMLAAVPELSLVACYDFRYDIDAPRELEDPWDDVILVLKRR